MQSERNAPEKCRTNSWLLLHDNAPAHRTVVVKNFLAKNNVTTLEHPPYSPDLAPAHFHLLFSLKSALKRRRFCGATDNNATEEQKRLSQNGFQECFQHVYSH
jgi:histone-lysine N-methyltransferase SETMAR